MGFLSKKSYFDKHFKLDDSHIYKNCVNFDYSNIYNDKFVVQGFCIAKDYCLVSAYSKIKLNSRVYLYEKNGNFKKFIELNNSDHVGGITFDSVNDIVYITGSKGKINAFDYNELISGSIVEYNCEVFISKVFNDNSRAATVYYFDNCLYVCTFSDTGKMAKFEVDVDRRNKKIVIKNSWTSNALQACIQGVCVFEYDGEVYYLFSQSFGRLRSVVNLYDSNFKIIGQKILRYIGLEGIDLEYIGNIVCVFENGIDKSEKIHISELVDGFNGSIERKFEKKGKFYKKKHDIIQ